VVGRYVLGPVIGVGGFAVVFRARDESLDADVALKILTSTHSLDPEIRERFVREARLLRRVRNRSVVTVHDVGEAADGRPYLVMDLAEGGVLQDRLRAATLPPDPATLKAVITTLAEGLGALHAAGVIHRDVKPANLLIVRDPALLADDPGGSGRLLAPGERLLIGDLGLAKDQLATARGPTMMGGTPRFQAPEQAEVGARIDVRTDVYAATAVLWVLLTGQPPPVPDELPVKLLGVPDEWRPVLTRGLAAEPEDRFSSIVAWAEAALACATPGIVLPARPAVGAGTSRATTTFPYKGLAPFQPEDAPLFFGRSELVDQLVAQLQRGATLVVGGPSGSGKSSLLRAGLLPALAGGALPGSERWPVCLLTPGEWPLLTLRAELGALDGVADLPDVEALGNAPELARQAISTTVLVAIDQFEELFRLCRDDGERKAFLRVLAALTSGAQPVARLVLAVRADFYGACAAHPWLAAAINDNHALVGPMSRAQLQEAIEGPARRVGLHLEGGLAERILADGADDAGALPLVAHALVETWLRRDGTLLTIAGYELAGGVAGAIGRTADEVWNRLDSDQQRCARRLLLRLVHPGQGAPDTKRLLTWAELGDDGPTKFVLSRFADSRLLTVDHQGVQLAHEALLRTWGRLAAWVEESRDDLRAGERIEDAAREWERQGRHPDLLYRGLPLAAALEWRAHHAGAVGEPTGSFLDAGQAARDAEEFAVEAQSRRTRRLRRRAFMALATFATLALVTSVVAVSALGRARRDERAARAASRLTSEQLARGLAASAVDLGPSNPYLATVLAAEAVARVDPPLPEARDALVRSRLALAGSRLVPYGDPMPVGDALAVAVSPTGDLAATGNRDGTLDLWDLARREKLAQLKGPTGGIQRMVFTADGRWLVAASADHRLWRWAMEAGREGAGSVLADPGSIVWAVAAAPNGSTVAATTEGGDVLLLDAAKGVQLGEPIRTGGGADALFSATFSPDGTTLLAGSALGEVYAWSLPSRQLRFPPLRAHGDDIWELIVPSGPVSASFVSVSLGDGTARHWNIVTGAPIGDGPFDQSQTGVPHGVRGATFGPSGDILTLGGPDGALYSWSLSERKVVERAGPVHRDRVVGTARSADGLVLVTLGADRTVQEWTQRPRPGPLARLTQLDAHASSIAVAPDRGTLAVGADDGSVHLLDPLTGSDRGRLTGHDGSVTALAFDGAGRLVTGDGAGTLRVWDVVTGQMRAEHRGAHHGAVSALALAKGRQLLASGSEDRTVRLWDAVALTGGELPLAELSAPVTDVAVGDDGRTVAASTQRGDVSRWGVDGRPIGKSFTVTNDTVWAIALGPGGDTLAAAGADEVLSAWSLAGGRPRRTYELGSQRGGALDVAFVNPQVVAVSSAHGDVQLADSSSGQPIGPAIPISASPIWHLATGSDGSIWTASRDGTVTRIDVLALDAACAEAAGSFDARQRARLLAGRAPLACNPTHRAG
jgi:WD40 repeat protein/energy-coupling factor transporter ATP-binding protein EcfA2